MSEKQARKQRVLIEIRGIHNLGSGNPNRDETGQPKTAFYGLYPRPRVSYQAKRRADREWIRRELTGPLADRLSNSTRELPAEFRKEVLNLGWTEAEASIIVPAWIEKYVGTIEPIDEKADEAVYLRTKEMRRIGNDEWRALLDLLVQNKDDLVKAWEQDAVKVAAEKEKEEAQAKDGKAAKGKKNGGGKKDKALCTEYPTLGKLIGTLQKSLSGRTNALDVALLGRMCTARSSDTVDGALYSTPCIGISPLYVETDFLIALDEIAAKRKSGGQGSAAMIAHKEFADFCVFDDLVIDVRQLIDNLDGDIDGAFEIIRLQLKAHAVSQLVGNRHTMRTDTFPILYAMSLRTAGQPISMMNAFRQPVTVYDGMSLTVEAAKRLDKHWAELRRMLGDADDIPLTVVIGNDDETDALQAMAPFVRKDSIDVVIDEIIESARKLL